MPIRVSLPVGAPANVKELEYLSAIQQTAKDSLRHDGSIIARDIRRYLKSRHGIRVPTTRIKCDIIQDLAGTVLSEQEAAELLALVEQERNRSSPAVVPTSRDGSSSMQSPAEVVPTHTHFGRRPAMRLTYLSSRDSFDTISMGLDDLDTDHTGEEDDAAAAKRNHSVLLNKLEAKLQQSLVQSQKQFRQVGAAVTSKATQVIRVGSIQTNDDHYNPPPPKEGSMDIVQMMALIFIPLLCEAADKDEKSNRKKRKDCAIAAAAGFVYGDDGQDDDDSSREKDIIDIVLMILLQQANLPYDCELTQSTMVKLLRSQGEATSCPVELIHEMMEIAGGGGDNGSNGETNISRARDCCSSDDVPARDLESGTSPMGQQPLQEEGGENDEMPSLPATTIRLNRETFLRALTSDVAPFYDARWTNQQSTIYQDARTSKRRLAKKEMPPPVPRGRAGLTYLHSGSKSIRNHFHKQKSTFVGRIQRGPQLAHGENEDENNEEDTDEDDYEYEEKETYYHDLKRFYTAPNIDSIADTYMSLTWNVLAWFTFAITFFAYFFRGISPLTGFPDLPCTKVVVNTTVELSGNTISNSSSSFGCTVATSIVTWIEIFIKLSIFGSIFIFLSTAGNSVYFIYENQLMAIVCAALSILTIIFYNFLSYAYDVKTEAFDTSKTGQNRMVAVASVFFGCILVLVQFYQLTRLIIIPACKIKVPKSIASFWSYGALRSDRNLKQAAGYKTDQLVENALSCHVDPLVVAASRQAGIKEMNYYSAIHSSLNLLFGDRSPSNEAMVRYHKIEDEREHVGGILWTFKNLKNRKLLYEEGVWIFPRLVTCNAVQWVVVLLIIGAGAFGVNWISAQDDLWLEYNTTDKEVSFAFFLGMLPGLAGSISTATVYVPSAVSTILQFRTGVLPSLRDKDFLQCRYAIDTVNCLFGAAFWGALVSGAVFWLIVSGIAFLFIWDAMRPILLNILANLIGVVATVVVKIGILQCFRVNWFTGFYRRRPAGINILNTVFECWNLGLSTWSITVRTLRLMAVAIFYIGRLDTPVLAPGVGWLFNKFPMDSYPYVFRKDLLVHEAHRHPFIERLGLMYMLKLRHGPDFGKQAGAYWRILFTLGLMPWLRKYRIHTRQTKHSSLGLDTDMYSRNKELAARNRKLERQNAKLLQRLKDLGLAAGNDDENQIKDESSNDKANEVETSNISIERATEDNEKKQENDATMETGREGNGFWAGLLFS